MRVEVSRTSSRYPAWSVHSDVLAGVIKQLTFEVE